MTAVALGLPRLLRFLPAGRRPLRLRDGRLRRRHAGSAVVDRIGTAVVVAERHGGYPLMVRGARGWCRDERAVGADIGLEPDEGVAGRHLRPGRVARWQVQRRD